ncbi:SDR family oxidoreductase [Hippea jasoniae]|uniref:SDR family oxidoreductase n=1 Tax=Hippea jasoniae TaxID=944479 RepID=UPI000559169A|nr:NAD(P)-dependent oxidoreductase [Hippea jasoniae]
MKVCVIGANGLVGNAIVDKLNSLGIECLPLLHRDFDITHIDDFEKIESFCPDIVINTAAYLGVEPCEANPTKAFEVNSLAVKNLAVFCEENGYVLAQVSSDAIFDGKNPPYDENSTPNPLNMYGLTKFNGELMVRNLCSKYYIFRIPILFGKRKNRGNIFIEKMYNLYKSGKKVLNIADDIVSMPSYNVDVAVKMIEIVINRLEFGIYHIFNGGDGASLYDFAKQFFTLMGIDDVTINRAKAKDFSKYEKGKKPLDTRLTSNKLEPLRNWKEALEDYVEKEKKDG